jgi:hypothetical protein
VASPGRRRAPARRCWLWLWQRNKFTRAAWVEPDGAAAQDCLWWRCRRDDPIGSARLWEELTLYARKTITAQRPLALGPFRSPLHTDYCSTPAVHLGRCRLRRTPRQTQRPCQPLARPAPCSSTPAVTRRLHTPSQQHTFHQEAGATRPAVRAALQRARPGLPVRAIAAVAAPRRNRAQAAVPDPMGKASILWFRKGLRLHDNPALHEALKDTTDFYPVFVLGASLTTAAGPALPSHLSVLPVSLLVLYAPTFTFLQVCMQGPSALVARFLPRRLEFQGTRYHAWRRAREVGHGVA